MGPEYEPTLEPPVKQLLDGGCAVDHELLHGRISDYLISILRSSPNILNLLKKTPAGNDWTSKLLI